MVFGNILTDTFQHTVSSLGKETKLTLLIAAFICYSFRYKNSMPLSGKSQEEIYINRQRGVENESLIRVVNMLNDSLKQYRFILASKSPRRKELLEKLGITFEVIPAAGEEIVRGNDPAQVVMNLARQKAEEVYKACQPHKEQCCGCTTSDQRQLLVIGSDTVVAYNHQILGKPTSKENAYQMLTLLSGNTHQVYTGVCLYGTTVNVFYERTDVTFYDMTTQEIEAYIATGDPFDKAGAYGIQGPFAVYVKNIRGDYNNVVGLPVARLYHELSPITFGPK